MSISDSLVFIEQRIFIIRGKRVMIDYDLAEIYGVETKYLNRQVRRNLDRFPAEFMFQLHHKEKKELVTNWHRLRHLKHSASYPYAFTENGVAMLASVLKSKQAVRMSILIVKTFVKLREWLVHHKELAQQIALLEKKIENHDKEIETLFKAIHQLIAPPENPKRRIGFI